MIATRNSLKKFARLAALKAEPGVIVTDPPAYIDFLSLISSARGIVTDSGGIQEESTFLQVPCVTKRDSTERLIIVELGSNLLAGTEPSQVMPAIDRIQCDALKQCQIPDLWDGHAAERIGGILAEELAE